MKSDDLKEERWPIKYRLWYKAHCLINWLAHKYDPVTDVNDPRNNDWIWRLNGWVGDHWLDWWFKK